MAQAPVTDDQLELERLGEDVRSSASRLRNASRAHAKALAKYADFLKQHGVDLVLVPETTATQAEEK